MLIIMISQTHCCRRVHLNCACVLVQVLSVGICKKPLQYEPQTFLCWCIQVFKDVTQIWLVPLKPERFPTHEKKLASTLFSKRTPVIFLYVSGYGSSLWNCLLTCLLGSWDPGLVNLGFFLNTPRSRLPCPLSLPQALWWRHWFLNLCYISIWMGFHHVNTESPSAMLHSLFGAANHNACSPMFLLLVFSLYSLKE